MTISKPKELIKRLGWTTAAASLAALAMHLAPGNETFPITLAGLEAAALAGFTALFGALTLVARDALKSLDDKPISSSSAGQRILWTFIQAVAGSLAAMTVFGVSGVEGAVYAGIAATVTAASMMFRMNVTTSPSE